MDMTENNDNTLAELFGEAAKMELADNGFSDGVMRRLDATATQHAQRMLRIWTAICCVAGVALLLAIAPSAIGDISAWLLVMPRMVWPSATLHAILLLFLIPYAVAICMAIYALAESEQLSDVRL